MKHWCNKYLSPCSSCFGHLPRNGIFGYINLCILTFWGTATNILKNSHRNGCEVVALLNYSTMTVETSSPWTITSSLKLPDTLWLHLFPPQAWTLLLLLSHFSRVRLFATPWTAAYQASPSMRFSRQGYWSGLPLPSLESGPYCGSSHSLINVSSYLIPCPIFPANPNWGKFDHLTCLYLF